MLKKDHVHNQLKLEKENNLRILEINIGRVTDLVLEIDMNDLTAEIEVHLPIHQIIDKDG